MKKTEMEKKKTKYIENEVNISKEVNDDSTSKEYEEPEDKGDIHKQQQQSNLRRQG